jgi:hypothetical protein
MAYVAKAKIAIYLLIDIKNSYQQKWGKLHGGSI